MRAVLENSEEDFIPLEKEIELLQLYTKLEHFRFQDTFDYHIKVDKNILVNDFVFPPMLYNLILKMLFDTGYVAKN